MLKFITQGARRKTKTQNIKTFLVIVFSFSFFAFSFSLNCSAQDKIAAIVNDDAITQSDLNDFLSFMRLQLSKELRGAELEERLISIRQDLLTRLIEDRLILQEAKKAGIKADESRVKARISEIKSRYSSDKEFQLELQGQGLTQADIESKIKDQFLMFGVIDQKIKRRIQVRPEEVTKFYNENLKEMESLEVREFEVFTLENEDLAGSFSYNLKSGQKAEDLAARYPYTVNSLKVSKGEELRKELEDAVFKLSIGAASSPINIEGKYYVVRVQNIIPPKRESLQDVQERIHTFLFEKKMQEEMVKWLSELKETSYIKITQE